MKAVFTVTSKQGKRIRLTEGQWTHILQRRPVMTGQIEKMRLSVEDPYLIQYVPEDDVYYYYKRFPDTPVSKKDLLLVVKHLNEEGFVITAFFVRRKRKKGKVTVYEKADLH